MSSWQEASEPIKLNEIAALGLSAVGTRLPAFANRGVAMCDSAQEFAQAIVTELARLPATRTRGEGLRSWQAIADQIETLAEEAGMKAPMGDRRLRVGVIGTRGIGDLQGGIERYCSEFYQHLPADRFQVTIFVRRRPAGQPGHKHIEVVHVPVPRSRVVETPLYSLMAILVAYTMKIKVIHVHGVGSCLALPLARLLGMRVIVRHLGADYDRTKWGFLGRHALRLGERFCARFATVVVCLNGQIAADFGAVTKRNDSVVVPNGVTNPGESNLATVPVGIGVLPNGYALAVSRIVPEKNLHQLIQAFLNADIPPSAKLVLVGEPDYRGRYERQIARLCAGNEGRILRIGTVFGAQLFALYRDARLFILPSSHEGMSFSLLEAGISGAQIIASDIAANREVCQTFGRLYPVGSETALRQALEEEWRCQRPASERAAQIAEFEQRFDWDRIAATMAPLFAGSSQEHAPHPGSLAMA
jgi:glycosyltransferase involved in cell wall biosynthesis